MLTGVCGELLRALRRVPDHCQSDEGVAQFVLTPDPGRLGLVPEHVRVELAGSLKERVAPAPDRPDHPVDRVHALYAQNRMRFNRVGPRRELSGTISVHPLHTPSAVRAAMAVDPLLRQDDVLTALMLQRSDPDLLTIPVTGGWSERARAHVPELRNDLVVATAPRTPGGGRERLGGRPADAGRAGPDTTPATGPTDPAPTPGADSKLMAKVNAVAPDRRELLSELFADRHNRTWDVLDRMAALEALARYEVLDNTERRELFGAATAVAWLDGH